MLLSWRRGLRARGRLPFAMDERRQHSRLSMPIEGSWHGASGASVCRIADVSVGGCFVQSLATPAPGEITDVTLQLGASEPLVVHGKVVYVERGMGFAVAFQDVSPSTAEHLRRVIAERT